MTKLESYLGALKPLLPAAQRDDIYREIEGELGARYDEREAELGRVLTDEEQEELLSEFGNPLLLAGRYTESQGSFTFGRELIGVELFPFYVKTLKVLLGLTGAIHIAIVGGMMMAGRAVGDPLEGLIVHFSVQFLIVSAIFAGIQNHLTKHPQSWNSQGSAPAVKRARSNERMESVVGTAVGLLLLPWIYGWLMREHVAFGSGEMGPVWHDSRFLFLGLLILGIILSGIGIFLPGARRFLAIARASLTLGWIAVFLYLLRAGDWVVLRDLTGDLAEHRAEVAAINQYVFFYGLIGTIVGTVAQFLLELRKAFRARNSEDRSS